MEVDLPGGQYQERDPESARSAAQALLTAKIGFLPLPTRGPGRFALLPVRHHLTTRGGCFLVYQACQTIFLQIDKDKVKRKIPGSIGPHRPIDKTQPIARQKNRY